MKLDKKLKTVLAALLVIVIIGGIIYLNRNQQMFERISAETGKSVYEVDQSKSNIFLTSDNNLAIANTSGITAISRTGTKKYYIEANTAAPLVRAEGKFVLIADQEGNDAYFIHDGKLKKHFVSEHPIISGNVNANGYFTLVTGEEGYRSRVSVYDTKGEELYKWKIGEYYVVDTCLADNGNDLVVAILSTDANKVSGGVAFVNIKKESVTKLVMLEGTLISGVRYNGGNVLAVGNDKAICFSKSGKQKWEIAYGDKKLQTFAAEKNGDIVFSFETGMNNSKLEVYSSGGKQKGVCELDYNIINIDINSSKVLATGSKKLTEITHKGIVRATVNMENELKYGALCGTGKVFFIAGTNVKIMRP